MLALAAVLMQAIFATIAVYDALRGNILAAGTPAPADLDPQLASAVWIAAYLAVVLGRWRAARWFALAAAVYALYALSAGPAPVADTRVRRSRRSRSSSWGSVSRSTATS